MNKIRLLCAFQALEIMQEHGMRKVYGVNKTQAKALILELTDIKVGKMKVHGPSLQDFFASLGYMMAEEGA